MDKQLLETTVSKVLNALRDRPIPLGVSNRHICLLYTSDAADD